MNKFCHIQCYVAIAKQGLGGCAQGAEAAGIEVHLLLWVHAREMHRIAGDFITDHCNSTTIRQLEFGHEPTVLGRMADLHLYGD